MAVDSNVLIFERIREELRAGKTIKQAVDLGFDRAFVTIVDTHITTILSSAILFLYGTSLIKGFARYFDSRLVNQFIYGGLRFAHNFYVAFRQKSRGAKTQYLISRKFGVLSRKLVFCLRLMT